MFHPFFPPSVLRGIDREKEERDQHEHIEIRGTSAKKILDQPEDRNQSAERIDYCYRGHETLDVQRIPACCTRFDDTNISREKMVVDGPNEGKYNSSNAEQHVA